MTNTGSRIVSKGTHNTVVVDGISGTIAVISADDVYRIIRIIDDMIKDNDCYMAPEHVSRYVINRFVCDNFIS